MSDKQMELEIQKKREELTSQITNLAAQWETNPEDFAEFCQFAERFHNFSPKNTMLIYMQNRGAYFCGSFKKYKELGYSVKRGEKGLKIFAPVVLTLYQPPQSDEWKKLSEATKTEKEKIKSGEYKSRRLLKYKIGTVFDISQTTCPLEDYPKILQEVGYDSTQHAKLFSAISSYSADVLNCPVTIADIKSVTLKGFYRPLDNTITINDRLNDTEKLSVLTHELGHALLHNTASQNSNQKSKSQTELEADAVSLMLQQTFGVEITPGRKRHLATVFNTFVDEQNNSGLEPSVTLEDVVKSVMETYNAHISDIQHYISNEMSQVERDKTKYFAIRPNEAGDFSVFGISSKNSLVNHGTFKTQKEAEKKIKDIILSNSEPAQMLPAYTDLQEKVLDSINKNLGKPEGLQEPYVHVIWSESPVLPDNSYLSIKDAQNIFESLDTQQKDQQNYFKTTFQIYFADGTKYYGRQDLGDGDGGMIEHIKKFWDDTLPFREDLTPAEKEQYRQGAAEIVKKLWDAYDNDYITTNNRLLERFKAQNDLPNIVKVQDDILFHLNNKRNRIHEFALTGNASKTPNNFPTADPIQMDEDFNIEN